MTIFKQQEKLQGSFANSVSFMQNAVVLPPTKMTFKS